MLNSQALFRAACYWFVSAFFALAAGAQAETSNQLWGSVILGHQKNEDLYMEVEIQPKTQFSGSERWRNIDATWAVSYERNKWFNLTGELVTGYTQQTNDLSSLEVTPRVGVRLQQIKN